MSLLSNNPFTVFTCILAIAGWIIVFVGLCTSYLFIQQISWWIASYELIVILIVSTIFWTNTLSIYYPVGLSFITIGMPYSINEIIRYISTDRSSLIASTSGYVILIVVKFIWIFLLGIQHDGTGLQPFGDLHHNIYGSAYGKAHSTNVMFGNNPLTNVPGTNYPTNMTAPTFPISGHNRVVSVPIYATSPPPENTVFLSPTAEYLIPVIAIHNYSASNDDPNELSFSKGETLYVHEKQGSWWQAKKSNGVVGMIPSNYVVDKST
ncbi:SH3 domain-containing protein [Pilobolus umbonatus]|nr:SH3 domain-containing protein [Pilobolus umbonatus]